VDKFSKNVSFASKLVINDKTLGPTKNFEKAIGLCTGDLIALSDQDDVWYPQKLEKYQEIFDRRQDIGAVFSNAEVVDESLSSLGYDMWQKSNFTSKEQERIKGNDAMSVLLKHYIVTGSTLIFRADFRSAILPIPALWFHDAWIALLLASLSNITCISESMMKYRQHSMNQLGGVRKNIIRQILGAVQINRDEYYILEMERYRALHNRLLDMSGLLNNLDLIDMLKGKIKHMQMRQHMPKNRLLRIPLVAAELMKSNYGRYARNWGSVAMDLLLK
jgi:hypothetical protein